MEFNRCCPSLSQNDDQPSTSIGTNFSGKQQACFCVWYAIYERRSWGKHWGRTGCPRKIYPGNRIACFCLVFSIKPMGSPASQFGLILKARSSYGFLCCRGWRRTWRSGWWRWHKDEDNGEDDDEHEGVASRSSKMFKIAIFHIAAESSLIYPWKNVDLSV